MWCIDFLDKQPGGPDDHHYLWRRSANLSSNEWAVSEHELIMQVLKYAGEYDQLNLPNLASIEVLARRAQVIEYIYQDKTREAARTGRQAPHRTSPEEQSLFVCLPCEVTMMLPALLDHAKDEITREAQLDESLNKARKARTEKK